MKASELVMLQIYRVCLSTQACSVKANIVYELSCLHLCRSKLSNTLRQLTGMIATIIPANTWRLSTSQRSQVSK